MSATITEPSTREWIDSLPFETYFWSRDVPGNPSSVSATLSRLAADPGSSSVQRVAHGLYWRCYPEGHPFHGRRPLTSDVSLIYAGPGAGYAGWHAVFGLGWAHQALRYPHFAVLDKRLRPPRPRTRYVRRRNPRRAELSWLEVSVLEALSMLDFVEYPWERCMKRLADGTSSAVIRGWDGLCSERLVWAAETDDLVTSDLLCNAKQIQQEIPAFIPTTEAPLLVSRLAR